MFTSDFFAGNRERLRQLFTGTAPIVITAHGSLQRGSDEVDPLSEDYPFWETGIFSEASFPQMYFIEKKYSGDPTNWWIPNRACAEAMLRSSGFEILTHPEPEVFVCRWKQLESAPQSVYPARP
jgi:tRNA (mo5U34)-methyltransferase